MTASANGELTHLVESYLGHDLSPAERASLIGQVEDDPVCRESFAQQVRLHLQLEAVLNPYGEAEARRRAERIMSVFPRNQPGAEASKLAADEYGKPPFTARGVEPASRQSVRTRSWLPLALAASLLAVAGVWWVSNQLSVNSDQWRRGSPEQPVVARVTEKRSEVRGQKSDGRWTELNVGQEIKAGDRIETGKDGAVTLAWVNVPTTLQLDGHSTLDTRRSTLSFLARGRLTAAVAKQSGGAGFVVETPQATATVLGTKFALSVSEKTVDGAGEGVNSSLITHHSSLSSTRLDVEEGLVRFTRIADGASIDVAAGYCAVAGAGIELKAIARVAPAEKFHRRLTFESGAPEGLKVVQGAWHWDRGQDGTGMMIQDEKEKEVVFYLPIAAPSRPFVVTLKGRVIAEHINDGACWVDKDLLLPYRKWIGGQDEPVRRGTVYDAQLFFIGRYIFSISHTRNEVTGITECQREYPTDKIVVQVINLPLQEIAMRELDAKETEGYLRLLQAKLAELEKKGTQFKEFPSQRLSVPPDEVK